MIELQSFTLSKPQITPIYCILMYVPIVFVHCNSGLRQVVLDFLVLINGHRIYDCEEHRMPSFLDILPTQNQSRLDDGVSVMGASSVIDVLGEVVG